MLFRSGASLVAAGTADAFGDGVAAAQAALDAGRPRVLLARLRAEKAEATAAAATAAAVTAAAAASPSGGAA